MAVRTVPIKKGPSSSTAKRIAGKNAREAKASALADYKSQKIALRNRFSDSGTSGEAELGKRLAALDIKFGKALLASDNKLVEDATNIKRYGKDAMKGKGFATTGRPKSVNAGASRAATQSGTPKPLGRRSN